MINQEDELTTLLGKWIVYALEHGINKSQNKPPLLLEKSRPWKQARCGNSFNWFTIRSCQLTRGSQIQKQAAKAWSQLRPSLYWFESNIRSSIITSYFLWGFPLWWSKHPNEQEFGSTCPSTLSLFMRKIKTLNNVWNVGGAFWPQAKATSHGLLIIRTHVIEVELARDQGRVATLVKLTATNCNCGHHTT